MIFSLHSSLTFINKGWCLFCCHAFCIVYLVWSEFILINDAHNRYICCEHSPVVAVLFSYPYSISFRHWSYRLVRSHSYTGTEERMHALSVPSPMSLRVVRVGASWDTQQRLPYNRNAPRKIKESPSTLANTETPPTVTLTASTTRTADHVFELLRRPTQGNQIQIFFVCIIFVGLFNLQIWIYLVAGKIEVEMTKCESVWLLQALLFEEYVKRVQFSVLCCYLLLKTIIVFWKTKRAAKTQLRWLL